MCLNPYWFLIISPRQQHKMTAKQAIIETPIDKGMAWISEATQHHPLEGDELGRRAFQLAQIQNPASHHARRGISCLWRERLTSVSKLLPT
jgi:hypothetical protein